MPSSSVVHDYIILHILRSEQQFQIYLALRSSIWLCSKQFHRSRNYEYFHILDSCHSNNSHHDPRILMFDTRCSSKTIKLSNSIYRKLFRSIKFISLFLAAVNSLEKVQWGVKVLISWTAPRNSTKFFPLFLSVVSVFFVFGTWSTSVDAGEQEISAIYYRSKGMITS